MPNSGHAEVRAAGVFPSSTKVMAVELSEVAHGWRRYPRAFSRCEMRAQLSTRLKRDLPMNPVFWLNSFVDPSGPPAPRQRISWVHRDRSLAAGREQNPK
jgi:hypothetical protein